MIADIYTPGQGGRYPRSFGYPALLALENPAMVKWLTASPRRAAAYGWVPSFVTVSAHPPPSAPLVTGVQPEVSPMQPA